VSLVVRRGPNRQLGSWPSGRQPVTGRTMWDAFAEAADGRAYVLALLVITRFWPRGVVGVTVVGVAGIAMRLWAHWH
jgi:hypothetical protein